MNIPLTQTKAWQNLQSDLKKSSFYKQTPDFSYLAILETTKLGNYLYLPYGPYTKTNSGFKKALKSLKTLATENAAFFIRVEPQNPKLATFLETDRNFRKTKDQNPKETWVIPLEDNVLSKIPKRTRGYFNTYTKKGIEIKISKNPEDIKKLIKLQSALAKSKNIGTFSEKYLKTELSQPFATLYTAEFEKKCIAAVLVFDDDSTRYYMQAASDPNYRKLAANSILVVKMLLDAKERHLQTFDFWGIAPDSAPKNHPWAGFTAFKKSFSGHEVNYCGTYDFVLNRKKYLIYSLLRQLNLIKRKIKR